MAAHHPLPGHHVDEEEEETGEQQVRAHLKYADTRVKTHFSYCDGWRQVQMTDTIQHILYVMAAAEVWHTADTSLQETSSRRASDSD